MSEDDLQFFAPINAMTSTDPRALKMRNIISSAAKALREALHDKGVPEVRFSITVGIPSHDEEKTVYAMYIGNLPPSMTIELSQHFYLGGRGRMHGTRA